LESLAALHKIETEIFGVPKEVKVISYPSLTQVENLLKVDKNNELRGLYVEGQLFVWQGSEAIHLDVLKGLQDQEIVKGKYLKNNDSYISYKPGVFTFHLMSSLDDPLDEFNDVAYYELVVIPNEHSNTFKKYPQVKRAILPIIGKKVESSMKSYQVNPELTTYKVLERCKLAGLRLPVDSTFDVGINDEGDFEIAADNPPRKAKLDLNDFSKLFHRRSIQPIDPTPGGSTGQHNLPMPIFSSVLNVECEEYGTKNSKTVKIISNPTLLQVENIAKNSKYKYIRGLWIIDQLYIWESRDAIHLEVLHGLVNNGYAKASILDSFGYLNNEKSFDIYFFTLFQDKGWRLEVQPSSDPKFENHFLSIPKIKKVIEPLLSKEPLLASLADQIKHQLLAQNDEPGGLYGAVRFSEATKKNLVEYCNKYVGEGCVPADKLHATVVYSRRPVNYKPLGELAEPVVIPPSKYQLGLLGDTDCLVLLFQSAWLTNRHMAARNLGASYDYQEYRPHVTLHYACPKHIHPAQLPLPDFPLEIVEEYTKPLNEDWKKSAGLAGLIQTASFYLSSPVKQLLQDNRFHRLETDDRYRCTFTSYTEALNSMYKINEGLIALGYKSKKNNFDRTSQPITFNEWTLDSTDPKVQERSTLVAGIGPAIAEDSDSDIPASSWQITFEAMDSSLYTHSSAYQLPAELKGQRGDSFITPDGLYQLYQTLSANQHLKVKEKETWQKWGGDSAYFWAREQVRQNEVDAYRQKITNQSKEIADLLEVNASSILANRMLEVKSSLTAKPLNLKPLPIMWYEDEQGNKLPYMYYGVPPIDYENFDRARWKYTHTRFGNEIHHKIFEGDSSKPLITFTNAFASCTADLAIAIHQVEGLHLSEALVIAATSCERCLNVLLHHYQCSDDKGYSKESEQAQKVNTHCELCAVIDPTYDVLFKEKEKQRRIEEENQTNPIADYLVQQPTTAQEERIKMRLVAQLRKPYFDESPETWTGSGDPANPDSPRGQNSPYNAGKRRDKVGRYGQHNPYEIDDDLDEDDARKRQERSSVISEATDLLTNLHSDIEKKLITIDQIKEKANQALVAAGYDPSKMTEEEINSACRDLLAITANEVEELNKHMQVILDALSKPPADNNSQQNMQTEHTRESQQQNTAMMILAAQGIRPQLHKPLRKHSPSRSMVDFNTFDIAMKFNNFMDNKLIERFLLIREKVTGEKATVEEKNEINQNTNNSTIFDELENYLVQQGTNNHHLKTWSVPKTQMLEKIWYKTSVASDSVSVKKELSFTKTQLQHFINTLRDYQYQPHLTRRGAATVMSFFKHNQPTIILQLHDGAEHLLLCSVSLGNKNYPIWDRANSDDGNVLPQDEKVYQKRVSEILKQVLLEIKE
jgi:hypothetical protein